MTPPPQVCIFLLQLGGPQDAASIRPFLRNLFADVLPLPRLLRGPLAALIAWRRTPEVKPLYAEIGGGSPLLANTEAQARALQARLADLGIAARVLVCMRYAPPRAKQVISEAQRDCPNIPWVALSLYPHYSFATSRSSLREFAEEVRALAPRADWRAICAYPGEPRYLQAMAQLLQTALDGLPAASRQQAQIVFSAHGLPMSLVRAGDPYPRHIAQTVAGVMARLQGPPPAGHVLCYQSRVGPVKWLEPATVHTLEKLGQAGCKHVVVVPVAFTSEHIETLHELDIQLQETARQAGITTYVRVPACGIVPSFIDSLAQQVRQRLSTSQRCCGLVQDCELGAAQV